MRWIHIHFHAVRLLTLLSSHSGVVGLAVHSQITAEPAHLGPLRAQHEVNLDALVEELRGKHRIVEDTDDDEFVVGDETEDDASTADDSDSATTDEAVDGTVIHRTWRVLRTGQAGRFPKKLEDCALIGSSAILEGAGHGEVIDEHKTVIRINRLPRAEDKSDFGSRTDIIYLNKVLSRAGNVTFLGGETIKCVKGGKRCQFGAAIIKSKPRNNSFWYKAPFPVAEQNELLRRALKSIVPVDQVIPSSGFESFMTFVPMCDKLTVYGFGGTTATADGHSVGEQHSFGLENAVIDQIAWHLFPPSLWVVDPEKSKPGGFQDWFRHEIMDKYRDISIVRT